MKKMSPNTKALLKANRFLQKEIDPAYKRRARLIFENLNLSGSEKVIDVGCGRGFYLKVLAACWPKLNLYGVDLNDEYLSVAKQVLKKSEVKLIKADVTQLPFHDNSIDRIIISEVLEHIVEDQKSLLEIYRILNPGGSCLITVPCKNYPFFWDPINWLLERLFNTHIPSQFWWLAGIWADHVRLYNKEDLNKKIQNAGLTIEGFWESTHYCFPFSHFLLYGIGKNLIQSGIVGKNFNRFEISPGSSVLARIIQAPLYFIDRWNTDNMKNKSSVNLVIRAKK
jgi:ubiquinone/menaquinone biosynthesis C-methylase UbiE